MGTRSAKKRRSLTKPTHFWRPALSIWELDFTTSRVTTSKVVERAWNAIQTKGIVLPIVSKAMLRLDEIDP